MVFPLFKSVRILVLPIVVIFFMVVACKEKKRKQVKQKVEETTTLTKQAYNFNDAQVTDMPPALQEVSGISYIGNDVLAAQEDETGTIYLVNVKNATIDAEFRVGGKNDYEDIVATADYYYLLVSNGNIIKVLRKEPSKQNAETIRFDKASGEFETLYLSADKKKLIIICKACGQKNFDAYAFDIASNSFDDGVLFTIDADAVHTLAKTKKEFRPSAAAIHPVENKLYILCSIGKRLLVAGLNGVVEQVYELDDSLYAQPEGLTFAPNGDMFISNEARGAKGNIYKLPYQRAR